jgi:CHAT domain-containing protein/tetratricopeptide (TPR) repeat protein
LVVLVVGLLGLAALRADEPKAEPLTKEQEAKLAERDRHLQAAQKLFAARKYAEGFAEAEEALALEREAFGDRSAPVAARLAWLAGGREALQEFDAAHKARAEVVDILTELHGKDDWRVTDARQALADCEQLATLDAKQRASLVEAYRLSARAVQLYGAGKYAEGLEPARKAADILKAIRGEKHPDSSAALNNLALLYRAMGDYKAALPLYVQARDLTRAALGDKHPAYATSLNNLAGLYQDMGDYKSALPLYEQARDVTKATLGEKHPAYATSLNNLALLYQAMGDYKAALPLQEQARDIRKAALGEKHPAYATSLNNLATLYDLMGDYRAALPLYEQARDVYKAGLGEKHPDYATALDNLATLYRALGDYKAALPLYERARDIRKAALGEKHPDYANSLDNLANLYRAMGDYKAALPLYEQARDVYKAALGEKHPLYADALNDLGGLYKDMGDYKAALPLCEQARDVYKATLGEKHPYYATALHNLGVLYQAMGDYKAALPLCEQALELRKAALGDEHPYSAVSLRDYALTLYAAGEAERASPAALQATAILAGHLDRTFAAQSDRQRLLLLADLSGAVSVSLSIAAAADAPARQRYAAVLAAKGLLIDRLAEERLALDDPDLATPLRRLRQARAGLSHLAASPPPPPEFARDWLARFDALEKEKEDAEVELAQKNPAFKELRRERHATVEDVLAALPEKIALVDFFEYNHGDPSKDKPGSWLPEWRLLAFVLVKGKEPVCLNLGSAAEIADLVRAWREAAQAGRRPDPKSAEALAGKVWKPVREHLGGATLVLLSPDGAVAGLPFGALPGSKDGTVLLEEVALCQVTSARQVLALAAGRTGPQGDGLLALGGLAYGTPPRGAAAAYPELPGTRLEAEAVARLFQDHFPKAAAPRVLSDADKAALQALLAAGKDKARPRYLHLATHAYFEPTPPLPGEEKREANPSLDPFRERTFVRNPMLLSGVVLAGANAAPDKGVMTAEEVLGLDLRGCELAVLSACETGLGKEVAGGEGVLGLQRAFQAAGARTTVVSLWSVNDAATSVLMEEFYTNLWDKHLTRLEALRQAQLTVYKDPERVRKRAEEIKEALKKRGVKEEELRGPKGKLAVDLPDDPNADPKRSPPAWWAGFVLCGDPGPLPDK